MMLPVRVLSLVQLHDVGKNLKRIEQIEKCVSIQTRMKLKKSIAYIELNVFRTTLLSLNALF